MMVSPATPMLSVSLYWSLPGPRRFQTELVHVLQASPAVLVRIDHSHIAGVNLALREALHAASQHPERAAFVELDDGVHLESAIGHHFGRATLSALELAEWSAPPRTTLAVTPKTARAREKCREYLEQFVSERSSGARGTARLVLVWNASEDTLAPTAGATVAFNGLLSVDEMHAYVSLRMVGQRAPGSTSLARHLVTEFAGSDPVLAEALMTLVPSDLLRLPGSLEYVAPQMLRTSGATGASALTRDAPKNTLSDWAQSRSSGPEAQNAAKRLSQRYWRACVRSLLPWLEEHRFQVVDKLRPALEEYLYPTKGVWKKANPWSGKTIDIAIDDLEFNDIVAMANKRIDPFAPPDTQAMQLVAASRCAKNVRDALAHMRPPTPGEIEDAVRTVEQALGEAT